VEVKPIAWFHTRKKNPYEAARQSSAEVSDEVGEIRFEGGQQFEQALQGLEGFSHLWLIYQFHQNSNWKPMVLPPRGSEKKIGVLATRSPYRPNSLGLSCVELIERKGLILSVQNFDLLDQTPIFDVKPYIAYADSFPEAKMGWLEGIETQEWQIDFSSQAEAEIQFLKDKGLSELFNFLIQQLSFDPLNSRKKRVQSVSEQKAILAYRTWRIHFTTQSSLTSERSLRIDQIFSGYSLQELADASDPYQDKDLHRNFMSWKKRSEI
jgi:tRNA-Thr(GGU) m(6)t(6)A37 methyltransferase TsaA